jgi:hypothetical protein
MYVISTKFYLDKKTFFILVFLSSVCILLYRKVKIKWILLITNNLLGIHLEISTWPKGIQSQERKKERKIKKKKENRS